MCRVVPLLPSKFPVCMAGAASGLRQGPTPAADVEAAMLLVFPAGHPELGGIHSLGPALELTGEPITPMKTMQLAHATPISRPWCRSAKEAGLVIQDWLWGPL